MNTFYQILGLLGAGLIVFILYQQLKMHPERFSRQNMSSSFFVMGMLALFLIAFTALLVFLVRL